jgi:predicted O-linked N-acetylglucosamine transferase (SPINDLY family)
VGIDIAIDLKGHTQDARPGIFSYRCAPVQASYLGYPGTLGAEYMDYLVADKVVIPPDSQVHYFEKIAYLPYSYQVNDTQRKLSEKLGTRESMGLPAHGFVFCCFNNSFKITPHTFDGWMRILHAVDGSVLWLLADNPSAIQNLKHAARVRSVDPDRLIFGSRLPQAEHLARHRYADLFLDTLPCNAHTTTSDALWAGLPVLTLIGHSFAGRVAASLLTALEIPELIAQSQEEYERLAIALACDSAALDAMKEKIANKRLSAPLYDTPLFVRHLETAFRQMYERHLCGLPPDHLFIQP